MLLYFNIGPTCLRATDEYQLAYITHVIIIDTSIRVINAQSSDINNVQAT